MKVFIVDETPQLSALQFHMIQEGTVFVEDLQKADFCLSSTALKFDGPPLIGGDFPIPLKLLEEWGLRTSPGDCDIVAFRWFDNGWTDQTLVGLPLRGMMNEGLGFPEVTGFSSRFIKSPLLDTLFYTPELEEILEDLCYKGFVSFCLRLDEPVSLTSARLGVPFHGLFNALEGCSTAIEDFMSAPLEHPLLESWTTNLLVTRSPFPHQLTEDRCSVRGLTKGVSKHFWPFGLKRHKRSIWTDSTTIGVATAWGHLLSESSKQVLKTCGALTIPFKQHRTDSGWTIGEQWRLMRIGDFLKQSDVSALTL